MRINLLRFYLSQHLKEVPPDGFWVISVGLTNEPQPIRGAATNRCFGRGRVIRNRQSASESAFFHNRPPYKNNPAVPA